MIIYIILLGIMSVTSLRMRKNDGEVLCKKDTTIINGIFSLCILISHSTQYYMLEKNKLNDLYIHFQNFHNQWVVTTFLAFSGYGVMTMIKKGGAEYISKYPKRRILKTLFNYDVAVILFLIMNLILGIVYSRTDILLSFFGITSVGNSNWYIFDILIMYIISYLAAVCFKESYDKQAMMVTFFTVIFIIVMQVANMPSRFISTILCYSLGVWLCVYKDAFLLTIRTKKILVMLAIGITIIVTYKFRYNDYVMNIASLAFVLLFVYIDVFVEYKNRFLYFVGEHAFSIFILQRIPMTILRNYSICVNTPIIFVLISFIITIVIAVMFDWVIKIIDDKLFA